MNSIIKSIPLLLGLCFATSIYGQTGGATILAKARSAAQNSFLEFGQAREDLSELILVHRFRSPHNGVHHFYFQQAQGGFPIQNAYIAVHWDPKSSNHYLTNQAVAGIEERIPGDAQVGFGWRKLLGMVELDFLPPVNVLKVSRPARHEYVLTGEGLRLPLRLLWLDIGAETYQLSWEVLCPGGPLHAQYLYIDAQTGRRLQTVPLGGRFCFDPPKSLATTASPRLPGAPTVCAPASNGNAYLAFPFGTDQPHTAARQSIPLGAPSVGSPFGWHDTTGTPGPDHTTLSGNNVVIDNAPGATLPFPAAPPNGGSNLDFSYPLPSNSDASPYVDAIYTNVFYQLNRIHDILYTHGFTEVAGNFQENNYGRGAWGQDGVHAYMLPPAFYASTTGSYNALPDGVNFGTGVVGLSGWNMVVGGRRPPVKQLEMEVVAPAFLQRRFQLWASDAPASFPAATVAVPLVLAGGGAYLPPQGCFPLSANSNWAGKVVLMEDGGCPDSVKIRNAQHAGAMGCVVCKESLNSSFFYTQDSFHYNSFDTTALSIPVAFLPALECQKLIETAPVGISVRFHERRYHYDRSTVLDNAVMMHELMHMVTDRLVNGANNITCFFQHADTREGWCDWLGLWTSLEATDQGADPVGYANYSFFRSPRSSSVRGQPYSTHPAIDSRTYEDIVSNTFGGNEWQEGAVWASMLWDVTWDLIAQYGYDSDLESGTGGNNRALQLVLDALTVLPCQSNFIDARDAILLADTLNYGGANGGLLWNAFAGRGLGYSADTGTVAYDVPPGTPLSSGGIFLSAEVNSQHVKLSWEAIGEKELDLWRVEENGEFEWRGKITVGSDQLIDREVAPGATYTYWLTSSTTGHNSNRATVTLPNHWKAEVYPNPSSGNFNIVLHKRTQGPVSIDCFSATGQKVREYSDEEHWEGRRTYTISSLPVGVYFIRIKCCGNIKTRKVLVR